ncbi:hypothetical protein [Streptomyces sp. ITFR-16]|uniref:hypothetical protein n=1 Tax=Streptomyces sp. ITFR-16 TaxID=3075198 RepID=UPI00288BD208|nr:hypothetical protein [Streptomyces sp. ITFR-16]WNI27167.1 hypothetical protein RLT58_35060 [Streptomyces sp. ITFR-16]
MTNIARILVSTAAVASAVLTSAGIGAADDGIGWPRTAAGSTHVSADGIGWPVAPKGDTVRPVAPQGDIGWPVAPTA